MINKQNIIFKYCKRILTFDLQVLYSPNEPLHFLGFFTSWIRIRIYPYGSGRLFLIRIRNIGGKVPASVDGNFLV